jgi:hypothetical protein
LNGKVAAPGKSRLTAVGIRCADHAKPSIPQKVAPTSPTNGGVSASIVRLQTKTTEFSLLYEEMEILYTTLKYSAH